MKKGPANSEEQGAGVRGRHLRKATSGAQALEGTHPRAGAGGGKGRQGGSEAARAQITQALGHRCADSGFPQKGDGSQAVGEFGRGRSWDVAGSLCYCENRQEGPVESSQKSRQETESLTREASKGPSEGGSSSGSALEEPWDS